MTLKLETGLRTDGLSLTAKVLLDARDGYQGRLEGLRAHIDWLEGERVKTQASIERHERAIKELDAAIYGTHNEVPLLGTLNGLIGN